jgi:hypothetical protein
MYSNNTQSIGGECRALQVPRAIADLQNVTNDLGESVAHLSKRLEAVLSQNMAKAGESDVPVPHYSAPTASAIQSTEFTLRQINAAVNDLLARLEV